MDNPPHIELACIEISGNNREKGFYTSWSNMPEKLMLVVTELSEALEELRRAECMLDGTPMNSLPFTALGLDISSAIENKVDYNKTRDYMHGKRF